MNKNSNTNLPACIETDDNDCAWEPQQIFGWPKNAKIQILKIIKNWLLIKIYKLIWV